MDDPNQDTTLINLCIIEIWLRSKLACCPIRMAPAGTRRTAPHVEPHLIWMQHAVG